MSSKHNKSPLILVRRVLAILAGVLFCVTLFSGYMHFFRDQAIPPEPQRAEPVATDSLPIAPLDPVPETTGAEEAPAQEETEAATEPSEAETTPTTESPGEVSSSSLAPSDGAGIDAGHIDAPEHIDETECIDETEHITETGYTENTEATDPATAELAAPADTLSPGRGDAEAPPSPQEHDPTAISEAPNPSPFPIWGLVFWCALALLAVDLAALLFVNERLRKESHGHEAPAPQSLPRTVLTGSLPGRRALSVGTLHQPGRRQHQQDSLGHSIVLNGKGVLAVVADGMGGLKDGDKVSQQIVLRTLELGAKLQPGQENGALSRILSQVNEEVNQALTPEGLYKCGSTMIAVLVREDRFQWISVGDSRIYLYRAGYVNRLNRDHDLLQEWMPEILSGQRTMEASLADPNARKLTSFIGMGRLRYVDGSIQPIDLLPGDRLVLVSDGVYGEVPEDQLAAILKQYPDVRQAAKALDQRVQANHNPHQDNYTALILGF